MSRRQVPKSVNGITIPRIGDDSFAKLYHIPVYRCFPGNYSWIESGACNKQVITGGAEKEQYTMQFTCLKSGRNTPPFIIFKGLYLPPNNNPRINTVAYELKYRLSKMQ